MRSKYIKSTTPGVGGKREISYYDEDYVRKHFNANYYGIKSSKDIKLYRDIIDQNLNLNLNDSEKQILDEMIKRMDNVTLCHSIENAMLIKETYQNFTTQFPETNYSIDVLMKAALFHDVGKIATPPEVLKNSVWLEREEIIEIEGEQYSIIRGTKPEMNIHSDSSSLVLEMLAQSCECKNFHFGKNQTEHNQIMNLIENHHIFTVDYGNDIDQANHSSGNYNPALVYFAFIDSIQAQATTARSYKRNIDIEHIIKNNNYDLNDMMKNEFAFCEYANFTITKKPFEEIFSKENLEILNSIIDSTIRRNKEIKQKIVEERERDFLIQELSMRKFIYDNASLKINEETKEGHISLDYYVINKKGERIPFSLNLDKEFLEYQDTHFCKILKLKDFEKYSNKKIGYAFDFSNGECKQIIGNDTKIVTTKDLERISIVEILDWAANFETTVNLDKVDENIRKFEENLSQKNIIVSITD